MSEEKRHSQELERALSDDGPGPLEKINNLSFKTILLFLFGSRQAILQVARNSSSIWYGLIFICFAGIAREYDQELILKNPLIYLIPIVASSLMILWIMAWFRINTRTCKLDLQDNELRSFFSLFWMTGPLAFLYAFPVEEVCTSMTAVKINLSLLTLVALWRVLLFGRILHVCTRINFYGPLISACCVVAYPSLMFKYISIVGVMSGASLSPEQEVLRVFTGNAMGVIIMSFFISLPITLWQFVTYKKTPGNSVKMPPINQQGRVSKFFVLIALILSAIGLTFFQKKLMNHDKFITLVRTDQYQEALNFVQDLERHDFDKTKPLIFPYTRDEGFYLFAELREEHPAWLKEIVYQWMAINLKKSWVELEGLEVVLNKKQFLKSDLEFLKEHHYDFNEYVRNALEMTEGKSFTTKNKIELHESLLKFDRIGLLNDEVKVLMKTWLIP
ncbi:hypothetical protein PQO03_21605 [Lentisphaera profundi]|uniref:Uncharacterized protein n=1 Tax=Lentisphaera profundi TaxID=1658616 RepID=A0ABY7W055_9BACT|nr:hypothetical protein [Lentisphaera profundi]WDE98411.1 hypothetical protein PQO03_21605 [Lentisphaera profundi]